MPYATLFTGLDIHPVVFALLTKDHSEVAFRVIIGLGLIALVWILAGLWLMHAGGHFRQRS